MPATTPRPPGYTVLAASQLPARGPHQRGQFERHRPVPCTQQRAGGHHRLESDLGRSARRLRSRRPGQTASTAPRARPRTRPLPRRTPTTHPSTPSPVRWAPARTWCTSAPTTACCTASAAAPSPRPGLSPPPPRPGSALRTTVRRCWPTCPAPWFRRSTSATTADIDYSNAQYGHNFFVDATPGTGRPVLRQRLAHLAGGRTGRRRRSPSSPST